MWVLTNRGTDRANRLRVADGLGDAPGQRQQQARAADGVERELHQLPEAEGLRAAQLIGLAVSLAGIDKARFRRPVVPGDRLLLKVVLERRIRTIWKFSTVAEVAGQEACSAEMMVMPG